MELTQIGKECHSHCAIYKVMGDCIMPREGVFTRVLKGGEIKAGDEITMLPLEKDRPFTAAVITLSDKGAAGEREDKSGPLIQEMLMKEGYDVIETLLLPDGEQPLKHQLMRLADQRQVNVIFTTGGTGFAERDVTPEATQAVCDRMAMGIAGCDPSVFTFYYRKSNAKPCCIRNSKKDVDRQSSGKPEGCKRESGVCIAASGTWTWNFCVAQMVNVEIADNS